MNESLPAKQVLFDPFPKQDEFITAALSGKYSFILYGGAIRGGKSFSLLALFIILCKIFPGSRWAIVRKNLPTIEQNVYPVWRKIRPTVAMKYPEHDPHGRTHTSYFKNKSEIIFFPESHASDKDKDRWKGFEVNGFGFEEINECQQVTLAKAFERAGSYVIPGLEIQPKPLVVATCNPTQGWVKERIYEPWKTGTLRPTWLYIQSRIYDNLPLLKAQPDYLPSLKENLNRYEYEVFMEGNWDVQLKTGGEFLRNFEMDQHVRPVFYEPGTTIAVSMDNNVYPYIALSLYQLIPTEDNGFIVRQFNELPCEDPNNTARMAGEALVKYLDDIDYHGPVLLHGDKSTKNRTTLNDNKLSFFQTIDECLLQAKFKTRDRMLLAPPSPAACGDFVNACFRGEIPGITIEIGENCKKTINDFIETKTGPDGGLLKVQVPHPTIPDVKYQKCGHFTDTLKDFMVQAFHKQFLDFTNRHKRLIAGGITTVNRQDNITF